jgi:triacylglycerol lipase
MLAQLLRRILLVQAMAGAVLGYWLWQSVPCAIALALLVPIATTLLADVVTAFITRGQEPWQDWRRALWGEMGAGLLVFLGRQPWSFSPPVLLGPLGDTPRVPVVLVHGYVCNHRIWDTTVAQLRAQGHTVYAVDLEPVFASIDDYVSIVESAVAQALRSTGQTQVALVGHSMGGLALRAWLRQRGTARAARLLTLGTPHQGTQLAKGSGTPNGRQMLWGSPWLAQLAAGEDDAMRRLLRIAITPQDNIVYPQRAQTLQGITPTVFPGLGHLQMCLDPDVNAWVLRELAELTPEFQKPDAMCGGGVRT